MLFFANSKMFKLHTETKKSSDMFGLLKQM